MIGNSLNEAQNDFDMIAYNMATRNCKYFCIREVTSVSSHKRYIDKCRKCVHQFPCIFRDSSIAFAKHIFKNIEKCSSILDASPQ